MIKKILIIIGIITGLILVNLFSINAFYNNNFGKKLYENKNFSGSLQNFGKLNNYIGEYNSGNAKYRLGEKLLKNKSSQQGGFSSLQYLEQALQNYTNSMKLNYTNLAEYNYNFVKKKLDELKKKMQEEKEKQEQEKSGEKKDGKDGKQTDKQKGNKLEKGENQEGKQTNQSEKDGKKDNTKNKDRKITEEANKQLKAYEEKLKQEQEKNSGSYGKIFEENNDPFDNFDEFFNNPFFDNSILDNNQEKDW